MDSTLIQTKLHLPQISDDLVKRPLLIQRLNQNPARKLTLISAPVGFGKTTLTTCWLNEKQVCWLSLDEHDNDPVQFWSYVVAALETAVPHLRDAVMPALQHSPQTAVTVLINQLSDRPAAEKIFLVLDDYHTIQATAVHESLTLLLTHLPVALHLVITTRADPPLPLPQLRVRRQMVEIRDMDLRFDARETAVFLNEIMQLDLSATDITTLESRTEGWIASLQLAALALQTGSYAPESKHDFVAAFAGSNRYLVDYLLEEVLLHQSSLVREFLLVTAVLDRFCANLCDAIISETPSPRATEILRYLESSNLFLIPLDQERRWYRYHHLFAELLRYRLHEQYPEKLKMLHHRASRWFAENGLVEEAIPHALAAEAYDEAADLMTQAAHVFFAAGKMATLQQWLAQLPPDFTLSKQKLFLLRGWILLRTGQFDDANVHLHHPLPQDEPINDAVESEFAYLSGSAAYYRGAYAESVDYCTRAKSLAAPQNIALMMPILTTLAWCAEGMGDVQTAVSYNQTVLELGRKHTIFTGTIASLGVLSQLYAQQGDFVLATELSAEAIQLAQARNGLQLPLLGTVYIALGMIKQQEREWETAVSHYRLAIELCAQWGGLIFYTLKGYGLLLALLAERDPEQTAVCLTDLRRFQTQPHLPAWANVHIKELLAQPLSPKKALLDPLTERELEIVGLMKNGRSAPQIADELVIGVSTVRTHIKRIYSKLNVHGRFEAVEKAMELGLITE